MKNKIRFLSMVFTMISDKRSLMVVVLMVISVRMFSQTNDSIVHPVSGRNHVFYIGTGTGINNFNALIGISGELKVAGNATLAAGYGIGLWGNKYSLAARYYRNYPHHVYYEAGFSHVSGLDSMEFQLLHKPSDNMEKVSLLLKPVSIINISLGYQFSFRSRIRVSAQIGYGFRTGRDLYEPNDPETNLNEYSTNLPTNLTPGGWILGFGISLGI